MLICNMRLYEIVLREEGQKKWRHLTWLKIELKPTNQINFRKRKWQRRLRKKGLFQNKNIQIILESRVDITHIPREREREWKKRAISYLNHGWKTAKITYIWAYFNSPGKKSESFWLNFTKYPPAFCHFLKKIFTY